MVIQGGGRPKGNTAQLIDSFKRGAEDAGHSVEVISLLRHEVKGCLGCNACRYGKLCIQKDSFNDLVPKIKEADMIVFASSLYFWTVSSRIKAFIGRFYCVAEEDPNPPLGRYEKYPDKDCTLLMTAADDFSGPLSRQHPTVSLPSSTTSDSTTKGCCWRAAAAIQMGNHRSIRQNICKKHRVRHLIMFGVRKRMTSIESIMQCIQSGYYAWRKL